MDNNITNNFQIGTIVASKSHPFYQASQEILIAGEPINLSPLMVIIEVSKETRNLFDENTGESISTKGKGHCKCIWYSLKDNAFAEAWFPFDSLKLIDTNEEDLILNEIDLDIAAYTDPKEYIKELNKKLKSKRVLFRTTDIETKKIKETASYQVDGSMAQKLSSLLSFVCPPLEIIQVKIPEGKSINTKFDSKSGERRHFVSSIQVKCRFYLGLSNKWSEHFLPIESVILLEETDQILISNLSEVIESNKYIKFAANSFSDVLRREGEPEIIMKPTRISYLNGRYTLKGEDIIHSQEISLSIDNEIFSKIEELDVKEVFAEDSFPNFKFKKGQKAPGWEHIFSEFSEFIEGQSLNNAYIHISYRNNQDKIVNRTLRDYFVVAGIDERAKNYLHGFCCSKQEERSFRYDKIQNVRALRTVFETENLEEILSEV